MDENSFMHEKMDNEEDNQIGHFFNLQVWEVQNPLLIDKVRGGCGLFGIIWGMLAVCGEICDNLVIIWFVGILRFFGKRCITVKSLKTVIQ